MTINIFDTPKREKLFPFTHTRPIADILCGAMTMRQRWEILLQQTNTGSVTTPILTPAFPSLSGTDNIYVNGQVFANLGLAIIIQNLKNNQALVQENVLIAIRTDKELDYDAINEGSLSSFEPVMFQEAIVMLQDVWDIFSLNDWAIRADFGLLTHQKTSAPIPETIRVIGDPKNIFIAPNVTLVDGVLNASTGPIYIAEGAEIMEGSLLRGPLYLGPKSVVKMGAKIYGATSVGAGSKVGGEIGNSVFFEQANKGHDGYLGNAVIGAWCNLGADTNSSNLKNNYDEVSIWSEAEGKMVKTGLQFCGLLMGDHSKCGINTMFNTGTVVGVSSNIYGGDFPEKYIPSFSWGGKDDLVPYRFDKALETVNRVMARRNLKPSSAEIEVLQYICKNSVINKQP